ncbi:MAG: ATP-binding cassette domain-containing protein [Firmicutes bacterium]|nr:ATP-binding cassette domain-containing protein [Bacillota bacterium]
MIDVEHVSKIFNKNTRKEKMAVNDISFKINKGEIVGYIGPNGAGKSTMIKMLCGILTPTIGHIYVDGIVPYKNRVVNGKKIGVVFGQRTQLWWDLPLIDSYKVLKQVYEISDIDFDRRLNYFNQIFRIEEHYNSTVRTLSLGERMKADIIASLLHNPQVLYLDEPTIGLDFASKRRMRDAIIDINSKYQTTIIITTHDMKDIEELCNKIIIVDKGEIIYISNVNEMKRNYGSYRIVEVNQISDDDTTVITQALNGLDVKIKIKNNRAFLTFDSLKVDSSIILKKLLNQFPDNDFLIKDDSIEDIIERIYTSKREKR